MTTEGTTGQEMLAALCLVGEGEKGDELFAFASERDQGELHQIFSRLLKEDGIGRRGLLKEIARLRRSQVFSPLQEIHPGWIAEKMEGESPRVVGLLCRFLPGDKVRHLINQLAPQEKKHLPTIKETYQVSREVVDLVQRLIEKKLFPFFPPPAGRRFSFADIARMNMEDLRVLFWDLGLEEIRKAFCGVESSVLRAFLARFSPKEAREIRSRIEQGGPVPEEERKEAQRDLVALPLEPFSAAGLLREVGFSVMARSLSPEEFPWAGLVCRKLSPEEGYRLKRCLQERVGGTSVSRASRKEDQEQILSRIFALAGKGLIRRYWRDDTENELTKKEDAA